MSDAPADPAPKKKGGLIKKLVMFAVLPLVLIGGGAGAGLYASGRMGGHAGPKEDPNRPKLMLKSEASAPASEGGGEGHGGGGGGGHGGEGEAAAESHGTPATGPEPKTIDPSIYQATYYPIEQPFTSNLSDTDGFLQVGLGVSTFYDSRVITNLKRADMPVRSAVLEVLSQQSAEALNSPQGKQALRDALKNRINAVLKSHEGFGGIDDVFFTSFIIQ